MHLNINYLKNFENITDEQVSELKASICDLFSNHGIVLKDIRISVDSRINIHEIRIYLKDKDYCIATDDTGLVCVVYAEHFIDVDAIKESCILREYPMILDTFTFKFNDESKLVYCSENGDKEVLLVNLYDDDDNVSFPHNPFGDKKNVTKNWCRLSKHDKNGMYAFVANSCAWGMNIATSLYDPKINTIYYYGFVNYDYPEGIALRYNDDNNDLDIYLSNDKCTKTVLYRNPDFKVPLINLIYEDSNWYSIRVNKKYGNMYEWLNIIQNFDPYIIDSNVVTGKKDIKSYCINRIIELINNKEYDKGIKYSTLLLQYHHFFDKIINGDNITYTDIIKYNLMCFYALNNNVDGALNTLKELKCSGFDIDMFLNDDDLTILWDNLKFKRMIHEIDILCNTELIV